MMRKGLYALAGCCIVGIVLSIAIARANRTESGLGTSIVCILVMTTLFVLLDGAVLILLGQRIHARFRRLQMGLGAAILLFVILAVTLSAFLFATCGVAVSTM